MAEVELNAVDVADRLADLMSEITALEAVLRKEQATAGETPQAAALLRLLRGRQTPQDASLLKVKLAGSRVVVIRAPRTSTVLLRPRLESSRRRQVVAPTDGELIVLVGAYPRGGSGASRVSPAEQLAAGVIRDCAEAAVGISSTLQNETDVSAAHQEAQEAATMAATTEQRWIAADEHWATLAARRLAPSLARCLTLDNPLARLRRYDHEQGPDLVETVATWLANNCDTARTSSALSVHPNTLRYRLRRAESVAGLDLGDPLARALAFMYGANTVRTS